MLRRLRYCQVMKPRTQSQEDEKRNKPDPVMSLRARDGTVLETILRPREAATRLVAYCDGVSAEYETVEIDGHRYVPYSPENNLLTHRVVVLPSAVGTYDSEEGLLQEVLDFIHRYVDLSPTFDEIAAHYILMTWGYDVFNELPYLRVRGEYGTGKSRFLLTVGSVCYKPIFASGASTVSPIFRLLDQVGGTLVVDEADFRASDERAEITKILNNGNAKGFPVLRSEVTPNKEFSPRAFRIFGPKLVATRHPFEDAALESRCLTEVLGGRPVRQDIPISLPRCFDDEAEALRNKLLAYRFEKFGAADEPVMVAELGLEPRRAQILAPLLSVATSQEAKRRIRAFVDARMESSDDRNRETERQVLLSVKALMADAPMSIPLGAVAKRFDEEWGERYGVEVANRWVGTIVRRLGIRPQKSNGVFTIPATEYPQLHRLFSEHGLTDIREDGDVESPQTTTTEAVES